LNYTIEQGDNSGWATDTWYHILVSREGNNWTLYRNGQVLKIVYNTQTTNYSSGTRYLTLGKRQWNSGVFYFFDGYIDEVRISNDIARESVNFTPPTVEYGPSDATWPYNELLLHMNGTDGSTTFIDSSDNGFTVVANGDAQIDTDQSKFNGSSGLFDGTGDYLSITDDPALALGSGDFTIDLWARFSSSAGVEVFASKSTASRSWRFYYQSSVIGFEYSTNGIGYTANVTKSWSPSLNVWYHIAITYDGTDLKFYIDGVWIGSGAISGAIFDNAGVPVQVGSESINSFYFHGWLAEFRMLVGYADWDGSFTPQTSPYETDANTSLLLHFEGDDSSPLIEDSSEFSNRIPFLNGNTKIVKSVASPIADSCAYFDGSGDYIDVRPCISMAAVFNTDFAYDFWFRTKNPSAAQSIVYDGSTGYLYIEMTASGKIRFRTYTYDNGYQTTDIQATTTILVDTWYHVAAVRESGIHKIYIDGILEVTDPTPHIGVIYQQLYNQHFLIGTGSAYMNGYLSELRFSVGTSRWTSNFTPESIPYERDENTAVLFHFTGDEGSNFMPDSSFSPPTEYVFGNNSFRPYPYGDAYLSTTDPKFSTACAYLDGTMKLMGAAVVDNEWGAEYRFQGYDFTIDFWVKRSRTSTAENVCGRGDGGSSSSWYIQIDSSGNVNGAFLYNNGSVVTAIGPTPITDTVTWHHIAFVRSGGDLMMFVDGIKGVTEVVNGLSMNEGTTTATMYFAIGSFGNYSSSLFRGYVDEFRMSRYIARWTADFTPLNKPYSENFPKILSLVSDLEIRSPAEIAPASEFSFHYYQKEQLLSEVSQYRMSAENRLLTDEPVHAKSREVGLLSSTQIRSPKTISPPNEFQVRSGKDSSLLSRYSSSWNTRGISLLSSEQVRADREVSLSSSIQARIKTETALTEEIQYKMPIILSLGSPVEYRVGSLVSLRADESMRIMAEVGYKDAYMVRMPIEQSIPNELDYRGFIEIKLSGEYQLRMGGEHLLRSEDQMRGATNHGVLSRYDMDNISGYTIYAINVNTLAQIDLGFTPYVKGITPTLTGIPNSTLPPGTYDIYFQLSGYRWEKWDAPQKYRVTIASGSVLPKLPPVIMWSAPSYTQWPLRASVHWFYEDQLGTLNPYRFLVWTSETWPMDLTESLAYSVPADIPRQYSYMFPQTIPAYVAVAVQSYNSAGNIVTGNFLYLTILVNPYIPLDSPDIQFGYYKTLVVSPSVGIPVEAVRLFSVDVPDGGGSGGYIYEIDTSQYIYVV